MSSGRPFTEADAQAAKTLLEEGASYREVARTLGRNASIICRRFPGRGWSEDVKREAARTQQLMRRRGGWIAL
ncbi:helix-turn-helix domain-containing protein [Mycolicibacterium fluoranthenivorans]|uniref:IS30 family transposase n=1 Tax=Mycolicibacterium fluoranthenivorans TaxID=258505 RepID=A0A7X5U476_9MYCO|nr:hypothetical protein [Mycolicibacterium fluoranthenivorans]MCV7358515.1 hypothetical protein [Mycolicibacterium fluoranthenivorans]NIH98092.1 IS30 family transposase [Mycolicibacterium fluoranthenivorans]